MNNFLKIAFSLLCVLIFPISATASDFTCPSVEELKEFDSGGYFAFKVKQLGLENYFDENVWVVGKTSFSSTHLDIIASTVKVTEEDKYPFDAANRQLTQLKLVGPYQEDVLNDFSYKLCAYNKTGDASIYADLGTTEAAYFVHLDFLNVQKQAYLPFIESIVRKMR